VPGFLKEHNIPAGNSDLLAQVGIMNSLLKEKFNVDKLVVSTDNAQIYLNHHLIDSVQLDKKEIVNWVISYLSNKPGIARVFAIEKIMETTLNNKQKDMLNNGYYPLRSGDIQVILLPQYIEGFAGGGTNHGLWNPYDAHIPLLWFGWGIKHGKSYREIYMTDIAPTLASLLHIQMPSGCIGHVLEDVMK